MTYKVTGKVFRKGVVYEESYTGEVVKQTKKYCVVTTGDESVAFKRKRFDVICVQNVDE